MSLASGKILGEAFQVSGTRATPAVDGLVFVADHADVLARSGQQAHEFFLRAVGILEFVNHKVVEARVPGSANIGMIAKQLDGAKEQVVEIERGGFAQNFIVDAKDFGGLLARFVTRLGCAGGHFVGSEAVIFGVADLRAQAARRVIVGGKIELREGTFNGGGLVVVIINREIARQAQMLRFAAKQTRAEGMEG